MIETLLINNLGNIGQNSAFLAIMVGAFMKIRALSKTVAVLEREKQDEKMCEQKHKDLDKHMSDIKDGNKSIEGKIDGLKDLLIKKGFAG